MNYIYQLNGIVVGDAPGSTNYRTCMSEEECGPPTIVTGACATRNACHCTDDLTNVLGAEICYRVDYSDQELPPLNEMLSFTGVGGGLDESVGVAGPADNEDIVFFYVPGPTQFLGPSNGLAIDWNNDGIINSFNVQADLNNDNAYSLLTGFDDWAHVHAFLSAPASRNFALQLNPTVVVTCWPDR